MADPGSASLSALWARALSGEPGADDALNELLAEFYVPVVHFLERRLAAPAARVVAADLAQETLVRIYRGLPGCRARSDAQLMAWVLAIARRVAADWLRSPSSRILATTLIDDADADSNAPDESASEDDRGREIVMDLLGAAYDALPPGLQELLWLRLIVGAEWAEIARELDTTEAGAKRRYQRVQRRVRLDISRRAAALSVRERIAASARLRRLGLDSIC